VRPKQQAPTSAGYSGRPLWKKLGYKEGVIAYAEGAPKGYGGLLGLPADMKVIWLAAAGKEMPFVHLFATSRARLKARVGVLRKRIAAAGVLWVSWPKRSSGVPTDITEDTIREVALPLGLVDVKVCAVDEVWSGLKLVIRKELR
jgi:hypothetical protein